MVYMVYDAIAASSALINGARIDVLENEFRLDRKLDSLERKANYLSEKGVKAQSFYEFDKENPFSPQGSEPEKTPTIEKEDSNKNPMTGSLASLMQKPAKEALNAINEKLEQEHTPTEFEIRTSQIQKYEDYLNGKEALVDAQPKTVVADNAKTETLATNERANTL